MVASSVYAKTAHRRYAFNRSPSHVHYVTETLPMQASDGTEVTINTPLTTQENTAGGVSHEGRPAVQVQDAG
jgi:hypothetical protein